MYEVVRELARRHGVVNEWAAGDPLALKPVLGQDDLTTLWRFRRKMARVEHDRARGTYPTAARPRTMSTRPSRDWR